MKKVFLSAVVSLVYVMSVIAQTAPLLRVDSIPALVTNTTPIVTTKLSSIVAGRNSTNDGGGGIFIFANNNALTTNDHSVFVSTNGSGQWVRLDGTTRDPKWSGITNLALGPYTPTSTFIQGPLATGISMVANPNDPALPDAVEESFIMEDDVLNNWYHKVSDPAGKIYYASANNAMCDNWTVGNGGSPILTGYVAPYVVKNGSTYYLLAIKVADTNLYLFSSTDKVTFTVLNGGSPVLTHSSSTSDWWYNLANPALSIVGSTWHLLIEGKNGTGGNFVTGYSSSTLAAGPNFNTSLSASPVLAGATGNPYLLYVPDRSAFLTLYGNWDGPDWVLRAASASTSSNLALAASWILTPNFGMQKVGVPLTDPTMAFSTTKNWGAILGYNYNQLDGYRTYGQFTLNQFYDLVTSPKTSTFGNIQAGNKIEANTMTLGYTYNGLNAPTNGAMILGNVSIGTSNNTAKVHIADHDTAMLTLQYDTSRSSGRGVEIRALDSVGQIIGNTTFTSDGSGNNASTWRLNVGNGSGSTKSIAAAFIDGDFQIDPGNRFRVGTTSDLGTPIVGIADSSQSEAWSLIGYSSARASGKAVRFRAYDSTPQLIGQLSFVNDNAINNSSTVRLTAGNASGGEVEFATGYGSTGAFEVPNHLRVGLSEIGGKVCATDTTDCWFLGGYTAARANGNSVRFRAYDSTPQLIGEMQIQSINSSDNSAVINFNAGNGSGSSATPLSLSGSTGNSTFTGNVIITPAGKGLQVTEGSNARMGVSTLVGGTVTVTNTSVTANTRIFTTTQTLGTILRPVAVGVTAKTVATSFTLTSTDPTDTSTVAWLLIEAP